jgi:regulator of RNase E activity RraA
MAGVCKQLDTSLLGVLVRIGDVNIATGDVLFGDNDGVLNLGSDLEE